MGGELQDDQLYVVAGFRYGLMKLHRNLAWHAIACDVDVVTVDWTNPEIGVVWSGPAAAGDFGDLFLEMAWVGLESGSSLFRSSPENPSQPLQHDGCERVEELVDGDSSVRRQVDEAASVDQEHIPVVDGVPIDGLANRLV